METHAGYLLVCPTIRRNLAVFSIAIVGHGRDSSRIPYDGSSAPFVKNIQAPTPTRLPKRWHLFLAVMGPGIVVMLADTDVGSIITAAQSGAQWGYQLLLLQFLLMPVLFVVQDLTVRLGVFTGKGHGELIREKFGAGWAWVSVVGLAVATIGALLTEFSGVAAVGQLFGVPRGISLALAVAFLLFVVWTGSYRRVERVAIALGLFSSHFSGLRSLPTRTVTTS